MGSCDFGFRGPTWVGYLPIRSPVDAPVGLISRPTTLGALVARTVVSSAATPSRTNAGMPTSGVESKGSAGGVQEVRVSPTLFTPCLPRGSPVPGILATEAALGAR